MQKNPGVSGIRARLVAAACGWMVVVSAACGGYGGSPVATTAAAVDRADDAPQSPGLVREALSTASTANSDTAAVADGGVAATDSLCTSAFGGTLTHAQAAERTAELAARIRRNRGHMKAWHITWFSIYAATGLAQGVLALASDTKDNQAIFGVGAGRAAIAAIAVPILGIRSQDFNSTGAPCSDLAAVEHALAENARLHRKGRGLAKHAGVVGLNLAAFLTLGLGYDLWARGAIGGAIGLTVGEIQIYTQPMGATSLLGTYGTPVDASGHREASRIFVSPIVSDEFVGLGLRGIGF